MPARIRRSSIALFLLFAIAQGSVVVHSHHLGDLGAEVDHSCTLCEVPSFGEALEDRGPRTLAATWVAPLGGAPRVFSARTSASLSRGPRAPPQRTTL